MFRLLKAENFDEVFQIMQESFPLEEYRPYDEQKALLLRPEYRLYGAIDDEKGQLQAFLSVYEFEAFVFVEHFAVSPRFRNQGVGGTLLQEVKNRTEKRICLEVELPQTEIAKRRIAFYQRNGFRWNEYPYIQPPISQGKPPLPLSIMSSEQELTKKEFAKIKKVLYEEVYGQRE